MNLKFKIKLVAIVATLSGTAWNSAQAFQDGPLPPIVTAAWHDAASAEPSWGGAFGAVKSATPLVSANDTPANSSAMLTPLNLQTGTKSNGPADIGAMAFDPSLIQSTVKQATMGTVDAANENLATLAAQWQPAPTKNQGYLNTGFSAAGVPLYSNRKPNRQELSVQEVPSVIDSNALPPVISSNSQLITPLDSAMPNFGPVDDAGFATGMVQSFDPNNGMNGNLDPVQAPAYFDVPPTEAPVIGGCQDCANGAVIGSNGAIAPCATCGPNGCYDQNAIDSRMGYFGAMSRARRYVELDALYFTRSDGDIVLSNFGGVGSFDGNAGARLTIGERQDATQGREMSYLGTVPIESSVNRFDAPGRLSALFQPSTFFSNAEASPFFNAEIQNERKSSYLHSIEFNKVKWGWDVVKSFIGLRYIYVDDSYEMFSQRRIAAVPPSILNPAGTPERVETANYRLHAVNNLLGVHVGREMFYDVGYRLSFSGLGKAGLFANVNRFESDASNGGTNFLHNTNDQTTLSTAIELNLTAHYQINRRARFRAGYQGLYLDKTATVSDNLSGSLSPFLGSNSNDSDSMYFHGINVGFEFYR